MEGGSAQRWRHERKMSREARAGEANEGGRGLEGSLHGAAAVAVPVGLGFDDSCQEAALLVGTWEKTVVDQGRKVVEARRQAGILVVYDDQLLGVALHEHQVSAHEVSVAEDERLEFERRAEGVESPGKCLALQVGTRELRIFEVEGLCVGKLQRKPVGVERRIESRVGRRPAGQPSQPSRDPDRRPVVILLAIPRGVSEIVEGDVANVFEQEESKLEVGFEDPGHADAGSLEQPGRGEEAPTLVGLLQRIGGDYPVRSGEPEIAPRRNVMAKGFQGSRLDSKGDEPGQNSSLTAVHRIRETVAQPRFDSTWTSPHNHPTKRVDVAPT